MNGMTVVAQTAQQCFYHEAVAEKAVPGIVLKIRGDDRCMPVVSLLHQLEEDVGLLRSSMFVPQARSR